MAGKFVIVGAGEAGVHAARALREFGHDGEIVLLGEEPHPPYERPPLSKFEDASRDAQTRPIGGAAALEGVAFIEGTRVIAVDRAERRVFTDTGAAIGYDRLLLATGARARRLAFAGGADAHVQTLRTLDDARRLRPHLSPGRRIAIIGGGLIGLEFAASARACGVEITVIEAQDAVLKRSLPAEIAAVVAGRHLGEGVRIICDASIAAIRGEPGAFQIQLAPGTMLEADVVMAGAGSVPNCELAEACGLDVANGIVVDEAMRTADPHIFAAGDCCNVPLRLYGGRRMRLESWRSAQEQGRMAAAGMLGQAAEQAQVPWFWSDHFDLGVQAAGLFDVAARRVARRSGDAIIVFGTDGDGVLVAAAGVAQQTGVARDIKLAEKIIERRIAPDPAALADPGVSLKSVLSSKS